MTIQYKRAVHPALIVLATLALSACASVQPKYTTSAETAGGKPMTCSCCAGMKKQADGKAGCCPDMKDGCPCCGDMAGGKNMTCAPK